MDHYRLGRDDWEFLQELQQWKKAALKLPPPPTIDTATRSAFTRRCPHQATCEQSFHFVENNWWVLK
jgi:hypothetical protein